MECGSINKAAQNLFVSQSSISNSIKKLEDELSIIIFDRTNHGIQLTVEGAEFVYHARQLIDQATLIKNCYVKKSINDYTQFSISTQHYAFTVQAFITFLIHTKSNRYKFFFREERTYDIIKDVHNKRSVIGIMFLSYATQKFLKQIFDFNGIEFDELKRMHPHVFVRKGHPLTNKNRVTVDDLAVFTNISFEQGINSSLNFAEEIFIGNIPNKIVYVRDRATMNNIIANTDSYNIGTGYLLPGIIDSEITSLPIYGQMDDIIIGWIKLKNTELKDDLAKFVDYLKVSLEV